MATYPSAIVSPSSLICRPMSSMYFSYRSAMTSNAESAHRICGLLAAVVTHFAAGKAADRDDHGDGMLEDQ